MSSLFSVTSSAQNVTAMWQSVLLQVEVNQPPLLQVVRLQVRALQSVLLRVEVNQPALLQGVRLRVVALHSVIITSVPKNPHNVDLSGVQNRARHH